MSERMHIGVACLCMKSAVIQQGGNVSQGRNFFGVCRPYEKDVIMSFARHYQTNESLPQELYNKLKAARDYRCEILLHRKLPCTHVADSQAAVTHCSAVLAMTWKKKLAKEAMEFEI